MSNVIDKTTDALVRQLERLDELALDNSERVRAECDRASALNNTVRNIQQLGDLYLRSEALRMGAGEREFVPGPIFARHAMVNAGFTAPTAKLNPANAWGDGSRTRINEMGEFEDGDE
mgnify:CR=1 FL=1